MTLNVTKEGKTKHTKCKLIQIAQCIYAFESHTDIPMHVFYNLKAYVNCYCFCFTCTYHLKYCHPIVILRLMQVQVKKKGEGWVAYWLQARLQIKCSTFQSWLGLILIFCYCDVLTCAEKKLNIW